MAAPKSTLAVGGCRRSVPRLLVAPPGRTPRVFRRVRLNAWPLARPAGVLLQPCVLESRVSSVVALQTLYRKKVLNLTVSVGGALLCRRDLPRRRHRTCHTAVRVQMSCCPLRGPVRLVGSASPGSSSSDGGVPLAAGVPMQASVRRHLSVPATVRQPVTVSLRRCSLHPAPASDRGRHLPGLRVARPAAQFWAADAARVCERQQSAAASACFQAPLDQGADDVFLPG